MSYSHLLVAVAVNPESHLLLRKAVSIARPCQARISLLTLANDPEMYNQFAAPMMENLRDLMREEIQQFLQALTAQANYPIAKTIIASGAPALLRQFGESRHVVLQTTLCTTGRYAL